MRSRFRAALLAVLLCPLAPWAGPPDGMGGPGMGGPGMGGGPPGPPAFLGKVFPPRLVMEHQQEIGLTAAQAEAIKQAMGETQKRLLDTQWKLEGESEALGKLLDADRVDEAAALAKLKQVTALEEQMKIENFTLLVRIKNQLDPQQQAKLRAVRPARPPGHPGGPPPQ